MAKKGATTKVGKGKTGDKKDFAASGVEGEKGKDKPEPTPEQQKRLVLIVDHLPKLNIELKDVDVPVVLEAVQVVMPDATEDEVVVAIDMFKAQQANDSSPEEETPPVITIAEKIVRIKEVLALLELEDVVVLITAIESEQDIEDEQLEARVAAFFSENIDFDFDQEDVVAALRQFKTENDITLEPTDEEALAKAHIDKIVETIGELDPSDPKDYTEKGKPDANVLADILDVKVSAAERDQAWKIYQEENRAVTIDQIIKGKRRKGMKI